MSEFSHYTEEDFQSYFDNNFTGNANLMGKHLQSCELCRKNFQAYSLVWSFAKNELQAERLRIDLACSVADKIFTFREKAPVFERVIYGILICLAIACLFLCLNFLISRSVPTPFIVLIVPFGLYLLLSYKEIKMVSQKFAAL